MIALSLLLHPYVASSQSTNSFKIVLVVNDQIITNFEIDQRMVMLQTFGAKSMSKKEIIDLLINERLFTHSAIELDVLPSKNEINKSFDDFAKRGNLSKEDLLAYLSSRNVSKETLLSYISSGLTSRKVIQKKFVNNMIISNADIALEIANQKKLTEDNSNVIEYSKLSASNTLSDIKSF
jgi:peptidyl-prolyl cis-trans isomerase SurA